MTVNIDGPPIPEACTVQSTIDTITLFPSNVQHGLNGGTYEYFYSEDPQTPAAQATYLGQGLSLTHTGLAFFTNYFYFIRSRNAYGVSGFLKIAASTSNDVTAMLAALSGKITESELGQELLEEIQKIPGLEEQIAALDGLKAYNKDEAYQKGQMVVVDGRIYQALQPVPADASGANAPPNAALWDDVGQSLEAANGLAQQVATNTADIAEVDGKVTATADSLQALRASARDDDGEGELVDALKGWDSTASYAQEVKVRAEADLAQTQRTTTLEARVGGNESRITTVETTVATNQQATATALQQLNASVAGNTAAIQQTSSAYADTAGKLSTMWTVKMQVNAQGQYVAAGIGLGIENGPAGLQSQFLVSADRFAVVNGINGTLSSPFVVQNGQVFINQAFINQAFIQQIILGMTLRSQAVDSQGRPLIELNMVNGTFTLRGQDASGNVLITNGGIYVYDLNGVERAALGRMT
ncbi:hypothetical protein CMV24_29910 [Pseudomonas plecoglossicida]|uniref:Chitin-binding type-3 domain-containing protein n=1 Tax=Pseudomonas plecoglossicida TaxID=70775 RepID=A0A2A3LVQ4_PSEDL|nr:hypothetical protein CMV24_29910 [Pseudomonas plecoglossicida]